MNRSRAARIAGGLALALLLPSYLIAQTPAGTSVAGFAKANQFGIWSKDRFADAVVVSGPRKTIYLSGMGAEDETDGHILHPGDFLEQCRYAHAKIKKLLAQQGANIGDIVKTVAYVTDVRFLPDYGKCRSEAYGNAPLSAHTMLVVTNLAHPGMLVEVDVTAAIAQ
jgi:enamine deaminase RidA (YjgF/YER057c/UK114 family)